jgi:hypothetical protein
MFLSAVLEAFLISVKTIFVCKLNGWQLQPFCSHHTSYEKSDCTLCCVIICELLVVGNQLNKGTLKVEHQWSNHRRTED